MTQSTPDIWYDEVILVIANEVMVMDEEVVEDVKEGLKFGLLINLPPNLAVSPQLLAKLFASDGRVRPFEHLR